MNDIRVCVIVSREHPQSLDFEMSAHKAASASAESDGATPQAVVSIYAKKKSMNDKLTHFMLIPKDNSGNAIMKGMYCSITCVLIVTFNMHLQKERKRQMKMNLLKCIQATTFASIYTQIH
jgi:hypothetical protein